MADVTLTNVNKIYPNGYHAVTDLNLVIADGEFLVLVGPSGCGKSTALRLVVGLERITTGEIYIGDRLVNEIATKDRDIAMVFQNYALYPHMTVAENVGFALKVAKVDKSDVAARVAEAARILDLTDHLNSKPGQLSGGQRQRVAMGRAIVRQPQVFLMDEPLSNLDAKLRVQMRAEIAGIQRRLGVTTIYVTHDQVEAMTMGDRVAVLQRGVLQQVDTPQNLYDSPANVFVAGFIGSPSMNLFWSRVVQSAAGTAVAVGSQTLLLPAGLLADRPFLAEMVDQEIVVGIRPEDLEDAAVGSAAEHSNRPMLSASTALVEALGAELVVHFNLDAKPVATADGELGSDDAVAAVADEDGNYRYVGRFSPRSPVVVGAPVDIIVDVSRLHFFDPTTGAALAGQPLNCTADLNKVTESRDSRVNSDTR